MRYVLREVPPVPPATAAIAPPPSRVAQMRECESGRHIQPLLFRPVAGERLCRACRTVRAEQSGGSVPADGAQVAVRGAAAVRAVLGGWRSEGHCVLFARFIRALAVLSTPAV